MFDPYKIEVPISSITFVKKENKTKEEKQAEKEIYVALREEARRLFFEYKDSLNGRQNYEI